MSPSDVEGSSNEGTKHIYGERNFMFKRSFNPIALRTAKTP